MSNIIYIGNKKPFETFKEQCPQLLHHRNAPANCQWNDRRVEGISFEWFLRRNGLSNMFNSPFRGFGNCHYIIELDKNHLKAVEDSLQRFKNANPHMNSDDESDVDISALDHERLQWLCYWIKWSFENCSNPIFWVKVI